MSGLWSRRNFLHLSVSAIALLAGCSVRGQNGKPLTKLFGEHPIAYQHKKVHLSVSQDTVQLGETFDFTVTNTSDARVTLGCGNPWTLQKQRGGQWHDVVWTSANSVTTCATPLDAGESQTDQVTLEQSALETETETVKEDLTPGKYRLLLLSTEPFLAKDFQVQESN